MVPYQIQEASCSIPSEWQDTSINIFSVGSSVPAELSFVITRDRLDLGLTLVEFAERRLNELSKALKGIVMIEQRQRPMAGTVALEAEFLWKSDKGNMYQRQTYLPQPDGERVLVFTATALEFIDDDQKAQIDAVLDSVRFRT